MKFNIVSSKYSVETREAENATDALIRFAADMDSDMGRYFKAVPAVTQSSEMVDDICRLIRTSELSADDIYAIFRALHSQDNYIGGKIWTTNDIKSRIAEKYPANLVLSDDAISKIADDADLEEALSNNQDQEEEAIDDTIRDADIKIHISDIGWDIGVDESADGLPNEVTVPISELENVEIIDDYLTYKYDVLVLGYDAEEVL